MGDQRRCSARLYTGLTSDLPSIGSDRRRLAEWTAVIASLVYALLFVRFQWGGAAAYVLASLAAGFAAVFLATQLVRRAAL